MLKQRGLFQLAFVLSSQMNLDMTSLFISFTQKAISLHQSPEYNLLGTSNDTATHLTSAYDHLQWLDTIPGIAASTDVRVGVWRALLNYLWSYDSPSTESLALRLPNATPFSHVRHQLEIPRGCRADATLGDTSSCPSAPTASVDAPT